MEFVLARAIEITGMDNTVMLSCGTDGTDGITDAAGAVADGSTTKRAEELGMCAAEYLRDNNSYRFFEKLGDLVRTGPTGTNVMDIRLVLVDQENFRIHEETRKCCKAQMIGSEYLEYDEF